jgi:hypothetical protein
MPEVPYQVTQRGVDRTVTFRHADDRLTYLALLRANLAEADLQVRGGCEDR